MKNSMTTQIHLLKIRRFYLEQIIAGNKTFEIRKNDRDFQVGDRVVLKEYPKVGDSAREVVKRIGYISTFEQMPGYCVFSLLECAP